MTEVKDLIAEVRRRDSQRKIFGASVHRYQLERASLQAVETLEERLCVRLPESYRTFLMEIGSGAGPYYGLWNPLKIWKEVESYQNEMVSEGLVPTSPSRPFPLGLGSDDETQKDTFPCDGVIPIAHQGCTYWSMLILTGEFTGTVWDAACFQGFDGEYLSATRPVGMTKSSSQSLPCLAKPPTFLEWYRGWLERCLADQPSRSFDFTERLKRLTRIWG